MADNEKNSAEQNTSIEIKDSLTIYQTADLREEFLAFIDGEEDIIINLDKLEDWDIAGLQLLVSLQKTAAKLGKMFQLQRAPATFLDTFEAIGLNGKNFLPN